MAQGGGPIPVINSGLQDTIESLSPSALTRAGTEGLARGPILPRASAALLRTSTFSSESASSSTG